MSKGKLPKASWVRRRASLRGHRGPAADHCEGPCKITCCLYVWGTLGRHEVVICGTSSFICFSEKYTSKNFIQTSTIYNVNRPEDRASKTFPHIKIHYIHFKLAGFRHPISQKRLHSELVHTGVLGS